MTDRSSHLSAAFREHPTSIGKYQLRPVTPGTYQLLADLGNPMAAGATTGTAPTGTDNFFAAVVQFVWIHSAPLEQVIAIDTVEDLPKSDLKAIAFQLTMEDVITFLASYKKAALRAAAAMAEAIEEEDQEDGPGKPASLAILPSGSPASSSPSALPETQSASPTSSGTYHFPAPSNTCTPQTPSPEHAAAGSTPLVQLPPLIFSPASPHSETSGSPT
jgi:hypothetical protein